MSTITEGTVHLWKKAAEQSVQWIGGILRDLQAFFWIRVFPALRALSKPARQPLMQTVWRTLAIK
jgi:hypothetical protein